ncbi:hypothetical protein ID866_8586 [Astraeus odoratus]|nr:hypothetical protein ID866_8586 [Astraeus odoratus]
MGRANAGKTTILQRVCNTTEGPEIFDGNGNKIDAAIVQGSLTRGGHNIENELVFQSNPGFVFHDSCGFEAGSAEEFEKMRQFVIEHARTKILEKRVHAIWFCIPMTDYHRLVLTAEKKFFDECDTGNVPVIVLLTKADTLKYTAIEQLLERGCTWEEAERKAMQEERDILDRLLQSTHNSLRNCKFPPQSYITLTGMDKEAADCTSLMRSTASVLTTEGLQKLLISTQQTNVTLNIEYAVRRWVKLIMKCVLEQVTADKKALQFAILRWFPFRMVK